MRYANSFYFSQLIVYLFSQDLGLTTVALINIILVKSPPRVKENSPPTSMWRQFASFPPYVVGPASHPIPGMTRSPGSAVTGDPTDNDFAAFKIQFCKILIPWPLSHVAELYGPFFNDKTFLSQNKKKTNPVMHRAYGRTHGASRDLDGRL